MVTPPSPIDNIIKLLNVPFDNSYKNVLDFPSLESQEKYMLTRQAAIRNRNGEIIELSFENCSYIRKDGTLKIPVHIDRLNHCNYCMYKNPYARDRWIYCFITNMRYINDNCTELTLNTDVFSTWFRRIRYLPSFVEREHTNDDTIGNNTVPEGLETGDFIPNITMDITQLLKPITCIAYTGDKLHNVNIDTNGGYYNGIPSAIPFLVTHFYATEAVIADINAEGNGDKIFSIFTIPYLAVKDLIEGTDFTKHNFVQIPQWHVQQPSYIDFTDEEVNGTPIGYELWKIDGYTPKNNKLLTYPYRYLGFSPPNGSPKIYKYEYFTHGLKFKLISEINPNPTVLVIPQNYLVHNGENLQEAAVINGYPNLSYRNDYYNTWLAQNSQMVNLSIDRANFNYDISQASTNLAIEKENTSYMYDMLGNALGGVANLFSMNLGGVASNIVGGLQSTSNHGFNMQAIGLGARANQGNYQYDIKSIMGQMQKQSLLPDTGVLSSSNATLLGYGLESKACFTHYTIRQEYARKIDLYFEMFGYQTNEVKVPNVRGRLYWNYIKTININLEGQIPLPDLTELKNIFNNGVTIWHDPNVIYNYKHDNRIVKGREKYE